MSNKNLIESIILNRPVDAREVFESILDEKVSALLESVGPEEEEHDEELAEIIDNLTDEEIADLIDHLGLDVNESEELDEVSKARLGAYLKKAGQKRAENSYGWAQDKEHKTRMAAAKYEINKNKGTERAVNKLTGQAKVNAKESIEIDDILDQLDEVSKERLGRYIVKAAGDKGSAMAAMARHSSHDTLHSSKKAKESDAAVDKFMKRSAGIKKAVSKLTKEEVEQIDELSQGKKLDYAAKAVMSISDTKKAASDRMARHGSLTTKDKAGLDKAKQRQKYLKKALNKEEVEGLDEVSKGRLGAYIKKAADSKSTASADMKDAMADKNPDKKKVDNISRKWTKRHVGINRAVDKLSKD